MAALKNSYSYADLVYEDYDKKSLNIRDAKNNIKKAKSKNKMKKINKWTLLKCIIIFFGISFLLLSKEVMINEQNSQLLELKSKLVELQKDNEQKKVILEAKFDSNVVERLAVEKLNMQYPSSNQITYLQLSKNDFTEVKKNDNENVGKEQIGVINALKQGITQVIGYLY